MAKQQRKEKEKEINGKEKAPLFPYPDPQRTEWLSWTKWFVTQTLSNVTELQTSKESHTYLS